MAASSNATRIFLFVFFLLHPIHWYLGFKKYIKQLYFKLKTPKNDSNFVSGAVLVSAEVFVHHLVLYGGRRLKPVSRPHSFLCRSHFLLWESTWIFASLPVIFSHFYCPVLGSGGGRKCVYKNDQSTRPLYFIHLLVFITKYIASHRHQNKVMNTMMK